jgi:deoxyribonuclease-4
MDLARRIGAHLPLAGGMVKAAERAYAIGANALQVFGDNPAAWRRRAAPPAELPEFRDRLDAYDIRPLAVHAAYLINLAGPDEAFARRSLEVLGHELRSAESFGARFLNVHAGSHRGTSLAEGIDRLATGVAQVIASHGGSQGPMIVIENSGGGGFPVGADLEDLERIAAAAAQRGVPEDRLGFCLDTAHLWAAGYPIDQPFEVDRLLDEFERRVGLHRLALVHLNDSKTAVGSHLDRHEHVGAGTIGERGLGHIVRHPRLAATTFIVETPGMDEGYDEVNVARALDLLAGRPLETLPPAAFEVRGSRSRASGPTETTETAETSRSSSRC